MGGTVKGRVTLRDRPAEYQDYSGTVVTVYGSAGPVTATTDSLGDFSISNAAEGLMPVYISRPGYLTAKVSNVPVARGQVTDLTSLGVSLIPGNIIDSTSLDPDTIFLEDLAGLARAIGSTATTTGTTSFQTTWNAAADLDGDLSVGASDLARLAQNWGLSGPGNHYRAPAAGTFFTLPAPVAATTTLTVAASPASVQYSDEVQLQATLTDDAGNALPYKMIEFHLGGQMKVSATDLNGVASVTMRVQAPVGPATFQAKFLGDTLNASVQQTGALTVTVENAELAYTGPGMITTGTYSLGFHLNQADDDSLTQVGPGSVYAEATPLAGSNLSVVTGTGTWDFFGDGSVVLTLANVPYSLSLSTTSGSSYSAPAITRTLRTYSTLALSGPASAEAGSTVNFVATLTPAMANKYITFSLDGFSLSQVQTDSKGRATATFTLNNYEGSQSVEAEFFGDPYLAESSAFAAVDTTVPVTEPATTTLTLGSMGYSAYVGDPLTITATLASEAGGLGSQGVRFNIYDANTMEWVLSSTGSLTTDSTGLATWVISSVNLAAGTYAVEAAFDGTTEWASSASSKVQLSVQQPAAVSNSIAVRFKIGPDSYTNSVSQGSTLAVVANYTTVATSNFTFAYAPEGDQTYTTLAAGIGTVDGKAVASLDTTALATGTYTFRVSDSEGLSGTATLVVTEPEPTLAATSLQVTNSYSSTVYTDRYEATVQLTSGGTYVSNQPVVFRIFDASGLTELAESEPILTSSTGSATLSILWVASGTGTYSVQAFYAGDTTYAATSSTSTTVFVGLENATLTYTGSLISDSTGSMFVEVGILQAADGELVGTYPSSGIALKLEIFAPGTTSPLTTLTQPVYSTAYWNSTVSGLTPTSSFDVKVSLEPNSYFTASPISKSGKTATYLEFVSADAGTVYTDRLRRQRC